MEGRDLEDPPTSGKILPLVGKRGFRETGLLAQTEGLDQFVVACVIHFAQIVEEASALTDEFEKTTTGVVVFGVAFEVIGQVRDALAEQRDLHFGGTCIGFVFLVFNDHFLFTGGLKCHANSSYSRNILAGLYGQVKRYQERRRCPLHRVGGGSLLSDLLDVNTFYA